MKLYYKMRSLLFNNFSGSERSVTVKKNIIASLFIKGCSIAISLLLVPMTLGYVSSELYGIWLTLSSIMFWINYFDVGFTLGLKNKLTEAIALKDWKYCKSLVSTTYFMMVLIFIPLCFILMTVARFIDWSSFLNVNPKYNTEIIKALYVLIACFCFQMIVNVLTAVISAFQKVALSSAFPVIGNFLSLITIYFLIKFCPPSLLALAFAISLMPIIVIVVASFILFSGLFKSISPSIKSINKKYIKDLWGLGARFFIIQIQVVVVFQSTNILISKLSGPADVTAYNIAYKYLGVAMMIFNIILSPLWPAFTDAYTKKDFVWMKNIYRKMTFIYIISVLLIICMVTISPFIYHVWIGNKAVMPFIMTFSVAIYMIIYSWVSLQVILINGIGAIKLQTYVTLIGLIVHIPLSLLIGNYVGAIGVVCSMILVNVLYSAFFTVQIRKILNKTAKGVWLN